jgi:hypothetical protein
MSGFGRIENVVGWSKDGRQLFAGGNPRGQHPDLLARRWDIAAAGKFMDIAGAHDTVSHFIPLSDQRMLFADLAGFGLIDSDGKLSRLQNLARVDVAFDAAPTIQVSPDARTVQVEDYLSKHVFRFSLATRAVAFDPGPSAALARPITSSSKIKLSDWHDSISPKLNGSRLLLKPDERSYSVAIVPESDRFVLGASWSLRLFGSNRSQLWQRDVPEEPNDVSVSADGKLIVAAYNDGTIRWHRASDGEELLALFMDADGRRWIAWTPQGYYDASAGPTI